MTDDVIFPKTVWERQKFILGISTAKGLTPSPLVSRPPKFCHKIRNLLFFQNEHKTRLDGIYQKYWENIMVSDFMHTGRPELL